MIDIEKFICSLLADHPVGVTVREDIHKALKDQGFEYKGGKIVPIEDKTTLQESEDKKIRKNLITFFKDTYGTNSSARFAGIKVKDIIIWLEKQSTPQVRNGLEWVNTIDDACDKRYSEEYAHGEYCHEQSFKWGFQEGVDWLEKQDELVNSLSKGLDNAHERIDGLIQKNNLLIEQLEKQDEQNEWELVEQKPNDNTKPKFKIGDIIRHKKHGFTCKIIAIDTEYRLSDCCGTHLPFDSQDVYELVEQKSTNKVEPKFKVGDVIKCGKLTLRICNINFREQFYELATEEGLVVNCVSFSEQDGWEVVAKNTIVQSNKQHHANDGKTIDFYQAVRDLMNGIARGETYSPESVADEFLSIAKKSIKQGEMKTTWSEEDEEIFDELIAYFMDDVFLNHTEENIVAWLKSLRPQINVTDEELAQAKKEAYNDALDKIEYHSGEPTFDDGWSAAIWYLKKRNARPQNTWKPSEAQMERLKEACDEHYEVDGLDPLYTLYQDLQKLRED